MRNQRFNHLFLQAIAICIGAEFLAASPSKAIDLCGDWSLISSPNIGNSVTRITAITAVSPDNAWAVGYWRDEPAGRGSFALRWNGFSWTETDLPSTADLGTFPEVQGADATPTGDIWVVGYVTTTYPTNNLPLVMRWRQGDWDFVETATLRSQSEYPFGDRGGFAMEVGAIADDDVWAVGIAAGYGDGRASSVPMALHWDGSSWTDVEVPLLASRHHELSDVFAVAHDDVWAVGDYRNIGDTFRGVTYHWDGNEWSHIPSPIEDLSQSGLDDIAGTGPNDVWAIGGAQDVGVVLMHWDGSQWNTMEPPLNSGGSLAVVAPNDLWVSGWNGFWHWDGVAWTEVPAQVPGSSYVIRSGGMEIVGACDIWSAGFWTFEDGITSFTLTERLQGAPTSIDHPVSMDLSLAFANPFPRTGTIQVRIPSTSRVQLTVYDVRGTKVRDLFGPAIANGDQSIAWDGRTNSGASLAAGVYFLKLDVAGRSVTRKLLLTSP